MSQKSINPPFGSSPSSPVNIPLSRLVGHITHAAPHFCYSNAYYAFQELPFLFTYGKFVEGWMVLDQPGWVQVVEHAWCELESGIAIDPTLMFLPSREITSVPF